jgi:hypothetical protein
MRSVPTTISTLATLTFALSFGVIPAGAQCTHIIGTPPPSVAPILASKVMLKKGPGGFFGDGNDRFKLLKGILMTSVAPDPVATDSFHITIRHTNDAGPTMLAISLPPGTPWVPGSAGFAYTDPLSTLGVRKLIMKGAPTVYGYKAIGKNVSILNTPVVTGDTIHLMIEIENGGVGDCFGATLTCTAAAAGATCH